MLGSIRSTQTDVEVVKLVLNTVRTSGVEDEMGSASITNKRHTGMDATTTADRCSDGPFVMHAQHLVVAL